MATPASSSDHPIEIRPEGRRVRVMAGGQVIAQTTRALSLQEASYPAVLYIPRDDVRMELLTPSTTTTHCPFKGDAAYFNAPGVQDVAWTYDTPIEGRDDITGHLSFYDAKVTVKTD